MTTELKAIIQSADQRVTVKTVILKLLELSPMTDIELCQAYQNLVYIGQAPTSSDQNIRTNRKKLHELGLIEVVGTVRMERAKKETRIWRKK